MLLQQLQLQTKQAHWNASGTLYYPLHLLLQEHYEGLSKYADTIAERASHDLGRADPSLTAAQVPSRRVAAGLALRCEVQIAYAIGVAKPTSIMVTTYGTGEISDEKLSELVSRHFDLRPKGIIQMLDLLRPIYEKTAANGHFGRDEPEFTWEHTDKVAALKADAGIK